MTFDKNKKKKEKKLDKFGEAITGKTKNKKNKNKAEITEINTGDTEDRNPVSHLNISGMNKEQAKEELAKVIDKKIENMQNRYTVIEYEQGSIFDLIQPEHMISIKEESEIKNESSSILDSSTTLLDSSTVLDSSVKEETDATLDSALDKIFEFFSKAGRKLIGVVSLISNKIYSLILLKVLKLFNHLTQKIFHKFAEKEQKASEKMCSFIVLLDQQVDKFMDRLITILLSVKHRFDQIRIYAEINKKKIIIRFGICIGAVILLVIGVGHFTAYEYIYNGKVLGLVKNQEDVYKIIDIIGDKLSYEYHAEITIDKEKDITFNKVIAFNKDLDGKEDVLNRLTYMKDMKAKGYGIFVNGVMIAVLESKSSAEDILDEVKDRYTKKDEKIKYEKITFAENVVIRAVDTKLGSIQKKENIMDYILTGAMEQKIHSVQSGETFSEIAKMYGMKQKELLASNPDIIPAKLSIGQEIILTHAVPLVTVQTVETATYIEPIPYEIAYENTNSIYKGEQTVKTRGKNGEREVVAEIVRNNGIETGRNILQEKIITEAKSQVVLVGTKDPPPLIGTGTFIYPIRGTLTSRFGSRWGRLHAGIDLAAPTGTKIRASDGGKVIFSGYNGALGYCIKIDHGAGKTTVYGHCSKLFVKKGEKVFQGQHIANVGNTGRSTGPHVHFEVHVNGKPKNPLNYL